jgi:hypothetical protein
VTAVATVVGLFPASRFTSDGTPRVLDRDA